MILSCYSLADRDYIKAKPGSEEEGISLFTAGFFLFLTLRVVSNGFFNGENNA